MAFDITEPVPENIQKWLYEKKIKDFTKEFEQTLISIADTQKTYAEKLKSLVMIKTFVDNSIELFKTVEKQTEILNHEVKMLNRSQK